MATLHFTDTKSNYTYHKTFANFEDANERYSRLLEDVKQKGAAQMLAISNATGDYALLSIDNTYTHELSPEDPA
ncbi:MAG TPA: hypothetical protein H9822_08380 [Candidatus Yaniella excrementavium]|nr:hypothetical protein [Candidatus Yaniella excrementavium]